MQDRIRILQKKLAEWQVDRLLIENPIDLFYLTGLQLSKGRLMVGQREATLFVDGRYLAFAKAKAPCEVFAWEASKEKMQGEIGFDSAYTTVEVLEKLKAGTSGAKWVSLPRMLKSLRLIKDAVELQKMKKAAEITWAGVCHVQSLLKENISEKELALEFEILVRRQGASKLSFDPIIAFGENSAYPHHRSSDARLGKNMPVLVDVGAVYDSYAADVTRVFFFGKIDPRIQQMYDLVRQAAQAAKDAVCLKGALGTLDVAARSVFKRAGVEDLYVHNLGHGIGLETHEYPSLRFDGEDRDLELREHMVFTIEPGLYQAGLGGIRHEDTGVVTRSGFHSFYPDQ